MLDCFNLVFFQNPRRINFKIHSHAHLAEAESIESSKALNREHYAREDLYGAGGLQEESIEGSIKLFQKRHELYPRL